MLEPNDPCNPANLHLVGSPAMVRLDMVALTFMSLRQAAELAGGGAPRLLLVRAV